MNIRDLKYLVALAEHQHFGNAAKACFVSQPALSMQIKKLETTLDVKLLERTNKSVMLTDIGFVIAERANHILQQVDEVHELAKLTKDPFSGEFRLGIFPTLAPYILPIIIPVLSKTLPKLSFYLIEEQTTELLTKLKAGKIDAALLALPIIDKHISMTPLFDEAFLLATSRQHPLAKNKSVTQQDLYDKQLLLLEQGHCLRDQALDLCHTMQAQEAQNFRATSLETLRHMVASNVGITLIPQLATDSNKNISYIPFAKEKPMRTIGLVARATSARHLLLEELAKQIKVIMRENKQVTVVYK